MSNVAYGHFPGRAAWTSAELPSGSHQRRALPHARWAEALPRVTSAKEEEAPCRTRTRPTTCELPRRPLTLNRDRTISANLPKEAGSFKGQSSLEEVLSTTCVFFPLHSG